MNSSEVIRRLLPWKERHARHAWRPLTSDDDGDPTASRFAGPAWLRTSEEWPSCKECNEAMPLFLQLRLGDIPGELQERFGGGVLQLFYCTSCDGAWEPFSQVTLVRIVPQHELTQSDHISPPVQLPSRRIVGWGVMNDYPHPQDHELHGLKYEYDFSVKPSTTRIACEDPAFVADGLVDDELAEKISTAQPGDKLAGWPFWIQGSEYPSCPQCKRLMQLVFQLDSNDNLDYMFGDVGVGHITQCPVHRDIVAFGWACG